MKWSLASPTIIVPLSTTELAHVLSALNYAQQNQNFVVPGTTKFINLYIVDQSLHQTCKTFGDDESDINITEVFVITQENNYRDSIAGLELENLS